MLKYGDKRNYPKINIFLNGVYECSTTWSKTCKEAIEHFKAFEGCGLEPFKITANFEKRQVSIKLGVK